MYKIFGLLLVVLMVVVSGSCSLIGEKTSTPSTSAGYPDGVVYKIKLSSDTYLCSSFNVSNTDSEISLKLNDAYSLSSDGKITWIAKEKIISAAKIEKITK